MLQHPSSECLPGGPERAFPPLFSPSFNSDPHLIRSLGQHVEAGVGSGQESQATMTAPKPCWDSQSQCQVGEQLS